MSPNASVIETPAADPAAVNDDSSTSDILDMRNEDGWEDVEADQVEENYVSLFDDRKFDNVTDMLNYCKDKYSFDIWQLQQRYELDFMGLVKVVNYVRQQVKQGVTEPDISAKAIFDDEFYLLPVLEDDAVLYSLEDITQPSSSAAAASKPSKSEIEVQELREQMARLRSQFAAYREDVQKHLGDQFKEAKEDTSSPPRIKDPRTHSDQDKDYFKSYSYNSIHESMLKDTVRTDAYRDFVYDKKDIFRNKVVLDVGCGTGILSMFCAKAGAKMVIAVDNSDIIEKAKQNFINNNLGDKIVCLKGKIEEVTLPVDKVDVIISEWMGYCLLYESMLDSVIYARDKYLDEDGLMAPSHVTIRLAPLSDSELRVSYIDFWKDVYGFDMVPMLEKAEEEVLTRIVGEKELASEGVVVLKLDLHTTKVEDLDFTSAFKLETKDGFDILEGFVLWFDTFFLPERSSTFTTDMTLEDAKEKGIVAFSTGPATQSTHWQQGVCLIKDPTAKLNGGKTIEGRITYKKQTRSHRSLNIDIEWKLDDGDSAAQTWFVE